MEFTMPAEIGNYLPLEVKLNIVLEVAFNSSQPGTWTPLYYAGNLTERDLQIHPPILTWRESNSDLLRRW
jgi:hypothetical protein